MKTEATPTTTEIIYTWPDGREEVRYRKAYGSPEAIVMVDDINTLQERCAQAGIKSPYSYRHV